MQAGQIAANLSVLALPAAKLESCRNLEAHATMRRHRVCHITRRALADGSNHGKSPSSLKDREQWRAAAEQRANADGNIERREGPGSVTLHDGFLDHVCDTEVHVGPSRMRRKGRAAAAP